MATELLPQRGLNFKVFSAGGGFIKNVYRVPVHYEEGGVWYDIKMDEAREDGDWFVYENLIDDVVVKVHRLSLTVRIERGTKWLEKVGPPATCLGRFGEETKYTLPNGLAFTTRITRFRVLSLLYVTLEQKDLARPTFFVSTSDDLSQETGDGDTDAHRFTLDGLDIFQMSKARVLDPETEGVLESVPVTIHPETGELEHTFTSDVYPRIEDPISTFFTSNYDFYATYTQNSGVLATRWANCRSGSAPATGAFTDTNQQLRPYSWHSPFGGSMQCNRAGVYFSPTSPGTIANASVNFRPLDDNDATDGTGVKVVHLVPGTQAGPASLADFHSFTYVDHGNVPFLHFRGGNYTAVPLNVTGKAWMQAAIDGVYTLKWMGLDSDDFNNTVPATSTDSRLNVQSSEDTHPPKLVLLYGAYSAPNLSRISPTFGSGNLTITLTGAHLDEGGDPFIALKRMASSDIVGGYITVIDSNTVTFQVGITSAMVGSAWDVYFENLAGNATLSAVFTVAIPTIVSSTPDSGKDIVVISVAGTNLNQGSNPTMKLKKTAESDIVGSGVTRVGSTGLFFTADVSHAALGAWDVYFENSITSGTLSAAFTVLPATFTLDSVSPVYAVNADGVASLTLNGAGLSGSPTAVTLTKGVTTLTGTSISAGINQVTFDVDLTGSPAGYYNVNYSCANGSGTLTDAFYVSDPFGTPSFTSITPDNGYTPDTHVHVTILGSGFAPPVPYIQLQGAAYIDAQNVVLNNDGSVECDFDLFDNGASAGMYDLYIQNQGNFSDVTAPSAFEVFDLVAPTLDTITPNTATNDNKVWITSLTGSALLDIVSIKLKKTGLPDITATDIKIISASEVVCVFDVTDAEVGVRDVQLTTSAGSDTITNGFTITEAVVEPSELDKLIRHPDASTPVSIIAESDTSLENPGQVTP